MNGSKTLLTAFLAGMFMVVVEAPTQTLQARRLTPAEESTFASNDDALADFWADWTEHDSVLLAPPANSHPVHNSVQSPADARVVMKCAASTAGLYLYCAVTDDIWVDTAGLDDVRWHDAVEVWVDTFAAVEAVMDSSYGFLSVTSRSIAARMAAPSPPADLWLGYWNDAYSTWDHITTDAAELLGFGIQAEVVAVDDSTCVLECFLSWAGFGSQRFAPGAPLAGERVALTGGYYDHDTVGDSAGVLFWQSCPPWEPRYQIPCGAANTWGDVVLPATMPPVEQQGIAHYGSLRSTHTTRPGSPRVYTLTGRAVAQPPLSRSGVVVSVCEAGQGRLEAHVVQSW